MVPQFSAVSATSFLVLSRLSRQLKGFWFDFEATSLVVISSPLSHLRTRRCARLIWISRYGFIRAFLRDQDRRAELDSSFGFWFASFEVGLRSKFPCALSLGFFELVGRRMEHSINQIPEIRSVNAVHAKNNIKRNKQVGSWSQQIYLDS